MYGCWRGNIKQHSRLYGCCTANITRCWVLPTHAHSASDLETCCTIVLVHVSLVTMLHVKRCIVGCAVLYCDFRRAQKHPSSRAALCCSLHSSYARSA